MPEEVIRTGIYEKIYREAHAKFLHEAFQKGVKDAAIDLAHKAHEYALDAVTDHAFRSGYEAGELGIAIF